MPTINIFTNTITIEGGNLRAIFTPLGKSEHGDLELTLHEIEALIDELNSASDTLDPSYIATQSGEYAEAQKALKDRTPEPIML